MTRDQYKTVTSKESFAILIPASPEEATGEATFKNELFRTPQSVRVVTFDELKKVARRLKGATAAHFSALLALKGALEANDELQLGAARERLAHAYRMRESENPLDVSEDPELDRKFGEVLAQRSGMSPKEAIRHFEGLQPGPKAMENPHRLFSYEVSQRVGFHSTQIVLWWIDGKFRPAIHCEDSTAALYIHTFFIAPTGGIGYRICPKCTDQFLQDRPNQDYCCPAHREAHRIARFRAQQKQNSTSGKEKREGRWHS